MWTVAVRGLQAYAVPSARAGQQPDPSARRDALSGLLTAGFLLAIIAAVLVIVIAAPEYAEPAAGAGAEAPAGAVAAVDGGAGTELASELATEPASAAMAAPTSLPPNKLKGYRWPVRGGMAADYYDWADDGHFVIDGRRVHAGLVITWFEGALVKAAHEGTVVSAGREWAREVGYDGSLDDLYARRKRKGEQDDSWGVVIDDGNGYRSVHTGLQNLRVKAGDAVKAGSVIGEMSRTEGRQMMRYQLVRMDGAWLKVAEPERKRGYPDYAREHVDPLAVLNLDAGKRPDVEKRRPPAQPPRLSPY
jgi:murein DD-endopeptidase MepM/ murein hydrolase activator NlpD